VLFIIIGIGVVVAGFLIVDWAIYHAPIVDDNGHERTAEREARSYPFKRVPGMK